MAAYLCHCNATFFDLPIYPHGSFWNMDCFLSHGRVILPLYTHRLPHTNSLLPPTVRVLPFFAGARQLPRGTFPTPPLPHLTPHLPPPPLTPHYTFLCRHAIETPTLRVCTVTVPHPTTRIFHHPLPPAHPTPSWTLVPCVGLHRVGPTLQRLICAIVTMFRFMGTIRYLPSFCILHTLYLHLDLFV